MAPLYKRLSTEIATAAEQEILADGSTLPSECVLAEMPGLSRVTVRKATADLEAPSLVSKRRGAKTTITGRVPKPISDLIGFSESLAAKGISAGFEWIAKGIRCPSPLETFALGIQPEDEVVKLKRLRLADGDPVALETAVVPEIYLFTLELEHDSLYATLARHGSRPVHGVQRISASVMTALTAQRYRIRRRISQIRFLDSALLHPVCEVGRRRIVALRDELLGGPVGEQRLDFRTVLVQLAFAGAFRPSDR